MVVWILKLKTYDQYDYTQTFATKEEAQAYINRTDRHYYIPVRAEINLKLREDNASKT